MNTVSILPSKEQRVENRRKVKERQHWTLNVLIISGILFYNIQIWVVSNPLLYVYVSIPGVILASIPFISAYQNRHSQEKKRRLVAKSMYEVSSAFAAVVLLIFLFSLFNTMSHNVIRGGVAVVTSILLFINAIYFRKLYHHLAHIQQADRASDRWPVKDKKLLRITIPILFVLILGFYFIKIV
ncbi:hypothetical protein [Alkalicoccobacillus murimartini]|uniref:DUF3278 domain-containing protein n=1 Tax=Alkalicoccobacillus murimartini TaxID=171685 RepID=A0ABT9YKP3_9BACI|nr:hypothetical protein [Alkalicoccobacillus murimartini]MDQ0208418.1 hypothetical protein [Alkalicoccobacillus murimartini]